MPESDSFISSQVVLPVNACMLCRKPVKPGFRGASAPFHDPVTGDLTCGACRASQLSTNMALEEGNKRPLMSRGITAYPLYLFRVKRERVTSEHDASSVMSECNENPPSIQANIKPMYNKCIHHEDVSWTYIDMDDLVCLCTPCSQHVYDHDIRRLPAAVSSLRNQLATVITTPLTRKGKHSTQVSRMDEYVAEDEDEDEDDGFVEEDDEVEEEGKFVSIEHLAKITLLGVAVEIDKTVKMLNSWLKEVMDTCAHLHGKVSRLRSLVGEGDLRRRLELVIQWRDQHFQDACNIYSSHLQSMLRIRQIISGTLLEGMTLLGLDAETSDLLTETDVMKVLNRRRRALTAVGEEVMVLRTLSCLRETLEYGNPLLAETTEEDVEGVLNQTGGLRGGMRELNRMLTSGCLDWVETPRRKTYAVMLSQVKNVFDEVVKIIPLLLASQPEYWEKNLVEWREKQAEDALNTVLGALFNQDYERNPLTHSNLNLFKKLKAAMGVANAFFIEGILRDSFPGGGVTLFFKAENLGCKHPLLYHYFAERYMFGKDLERMNPIKACNYAVKSIAGGCTLGHLDLYDFCFYGGAVMNDSGDNGPLYHSIKRANNYLDDLEREGYVDGKVFAYCMNDPDTYLYLSPEVARVQLGRLKHAIDVGYVQAYVTLAERLFSGSETIPADPFTGMCVLLEAAANGVTDGHVLAFTIGHLCSAYGLRAPRAYMQGFLDVGQLALHYCDVMIQKGYSFGYLMKGYIYWHGSVGVRQNASHAVSVWKEADRLGLADFRIYISANWGLIPAYMYGIGVRRDYARAIEYCKKAFPLVMDADARRTARDSTFQ